MSRPRKDTTDKKVILPGTLYFDEQGIPFVWTKLMFPFEYGEDETTFDVHYVKMSLPLIRDGIPVQFDNMNDTDAFNLCWDLINGFADEKFDPLPFPVDCIAIAGHDNIDYFDGAEIVNNYIKLFQWAATESQKLTVKVEGNVVAVPTHVWGKTSKSTTFYLDSGTTKDKVTKIYMRSPRAVETQDDEDNKNRIYSYVKFLTTLVYKIETESGKTFDGKVFKSSVSLKNMHLLDAFMITKMFDELKQAINSFRSRPPVRSDELLQMDDLNGKGSGSDL